MMMMMTIYLYVYLNMHPSLPTYLAGRTSRLVKFSLTKRAGQGDGMLVGHSVAFGTSPMGTGSAFSCPIEEVSEWWMDVQGGVMDRCDDGMYVCIYVFLFVCMYVCRC